MLHRHRWEFVRAIPHVSGTLSEWNEWRCVKCHKYRVHYFINPPARRAGD